MQMTARQIREDKLIARRKLLKKLKDRLVLVPMLLEHETVTPPDLWTALSDE